MRLPEVNGFQFNLDDRVVYALIAFGLLACAIVLISDAKSKRPPTVVAIQKPCKCQEKHPVNQNLDSMVNDVD